VDRARARVSSDAYRHAGGPATVDRRGHFSMQIAQLGHITETAATDWLTPNPRSPPRADSAAWIDEVQTGPAAAWMNTDSAGRRTGKEDSQSMVALRGDHAALLPLLSRAVILAGPPTSVTRPGARGAATTLVMRARYLVRGL
jgi:hypothetical protein